MSEFYGPALPPGLSSAQPDDVEEEEHVIGPALPKVRAGESGSVHGPGDVLETVQDGRGIGPVQPLNEETESATAQCTSTPPKKTYGPALPPDISRNVQQTAGVSKSTYGPALPEGFCTSQQREEEEVAGEEKEEEEGKGNEAREEEEGEEEEGKASQTHEWFGVDEEEDTVIGPLPVAHVKKDELEQVQRRAAFESRAKSMKERLTGVSKQEPQGPKREEWMTELPPEVKAFGLGPRKFRTRNFDPGDRSVWTDTPADRLKKAQEAAAGKKRTSQKETAVPTSARDKMLAVQVEDYNKGHRSKSLVEIHRKRRAEEKSAEDVRRPFDRERDLQLPQNVVTPAKRRALMKDSAAALKNKFSHGSQRFL